MNEDNITGNQRAFIKSCEIAASMHHDENLAKLLNEKHPMLDDLTPLQLLACGRSYEWLALMQRIDDGYFT
jgi:hypothetical protein